MGKVRTNRPISWVLIVICTAILAWLTLSGCESDPSLDSGSQQNLSLVEISDQEIFHKYFSEMGLGRLNSIFTGSITKGVNTFFPHQEGRLYLGFKTKDDVAISAAVFDKDNYSFIQRCQTSFYSEGADGCEIEILEYKFLPPGDYEYRVYVEDDLAASIPFKIISYFNCFLNF
jgi:hypothetical protein